MHRRPRLVRAVCGARALFVPRAPAPSVGDQRPGIAVQCADMMRAHADHLLVVPPAGSAARSVGRLARFTVCGRD